MDKVRIVFVVGLSGAGRITALHVFEDLGFLTIDRLPIPLLFSYLNLVQSGNELYRRSALLLEFRSESEVAEFVSRIKTLPAGESELVFVEASDLVLMRRYSETRRRHPTHDPAHDTTIADAVQRERRILGELRDIANLVINTSDLTSHDLKRRIQEYAGTQLNAPKSVRLNFVSFGFKYGVPLDCDLVMDVRFLPNPHFIDEYREKTGEDDAVRDFVLNHSEVTEFLRRFSELLSFLLPRYLNEGKAYLKIGIGCTGGRHRSVVIAEELSKLVSGHNYLVNVQHRDIEKELRKFDLVFQALYFITPELF